MHLLDCLNKYSGLYTLRETSIYARIPLTTLRYWFVGEKNHPPVRKAIIDDGGMLYVTFQDFIEAVAIRELRTSYNIPLPKIREAVIEAQNQYGVEYPFSNKEHKTKTDGTNLHFYFKNKGNPVQLTGKGKRQISFETCVESFMRNLVFDKKGIAYEYIAARYRDSKITINPNIMFGSPRVSQSPYSAITLWRARNAEGKIAAVSRIYGVESKIVRASCKYCEEDLHLAA